MNDVRVDRSSSFEVNTTPSALWAILTNTAAYADWWPWLESGALPDLTEGARADVVLKPPMPYRLHVNLEVVEVAAASHVTVVIAGDVGGRARLDLAAAGPDATRVTLDFALVVQRPGLKRIPGAAAPVLHLGHRIVMAQGRAQFLRATGLTSPEADRLRRHHRVTVLAAGVLSAVAVGVVSLPRCRSAGGMRPWPDGTRVERPRTCRRGSRW